MVSPPIQPSKVPMVPMVTPCKIKIFMMLLEVAPIDFRTAISLFFSMTTIISVVIMLKVATRTMRLRMINMTLFSSLRAEKRFLFISIQFRAQ